MGSGASPLPHGRGSKSAHTGAAGYLTPSEIERLLRRAELENVGRASIRRGVRDDAVGAGKRIMKARRRGQGCIVSRQFTSSQGVIGGKAVPGSAARAQRPSHQSQNRPPAVGPRNREARVGRRRMKR